MPESLASFRGRVECARGAAPLGLTLTGFTAEHPGERTMLAFSTSVPAPDFPDSLQDPVIEQLGARRYRIGSGSRSWMIEASAVHLHRDVGAVFYRALPPRPVPLLRRVFWALVLTLAASRAGLRLLKTLRR
jgi:hypothetical protein